LTFSDQDFEKAFSDDWAAIKKDVIMVKIVKLTPRGGLISVLAI
jgi:hypothetical protein